jgi:hypothetical protein
MCCQSRVDFRSFNRSLIYMYFVSCDQGPNDICKLREEEREAIETGIEDTKNGLQLEDIQLIQEFNLVSVCLEENSGIDAVSRSFMSSFFSICICKPACLLQ